MEVDRGHACSLLRGDSVYGRGSGVAAIRVADPELQRQSGNGLVGSPRQHEKAQSGDTTTCLTSAQTVLRPARGFTAYVGARHLDLRFVFGAGRESGDRPERRASHWGRGKSI